MQKLIAGCGAHHVKQEGEVTTDIRPFPCVDFVADLNVRWPFVDGQFIHVSAIHLVEHLDSLLHFMDEAWRVLAPGGTLYIETPLAGGDVDLEFCDPTHVRCYRKHSFINYFTIEGIRQFGYTDKPWAILLIEDDGKVLRFHGMPIKNHD